MFLKNLIGTKAKVKLLRVLTESRTAFTLQDLKKETELSIGIIHQSLQDLVEDGLVIKIKGSRKERLFKFQTESPFAHQVFELFRIEKTIQRKEAVLLHTWNVLESLVAKIEAQSSFILLFGSQARGQATLRSDIDVLIIPKNSNGEILKIIETIKSRNKINPTIFSLSAFQKERGNNTLFYRNLKCDSLILHLDKAVKKEIEPFLRDIGYKEDKNG